MKKYSGYIVLGMLALFIGLVLSVQMRMTAGSDQGGLVPLVKLRGYEAELKNVKDEKEIVVQQLVELEERLNSIEGDKAKEDDFINGLVSDLEKYKIAAGVLDVQGPGVLVTIKDPITSDEYEQDFSPIMYNYELLLSLVNKLKEAGAEGVSINEQRIVGTTEISMAGSNVNINGIPTAPPYYVKAIGNPDTLHDAINIRSGILETMKLKYNLIVTTEKKDNMVIPRYTGTINFKYAKPVESEKPE
ncbi:DUF881 domain-containing protein [Aminipila butyrica]|uniref:DUF881 domain-containing protein n=1 Tax=Aminipila butyrica TaxID=433296 RepID=A0A858BVL8_9FIRM|nr:DUF881 domain-containing protein [Aminipila butyrica]QIB70091.1 DUF881 domain-containing protein [Aminipila butyrica]